TSWEPLALTGGTPVELPEAGAAGGGGGRGGPLGGRIDEGTGEGTTKPARPGEGGGVKRPLRGPRSLAIERTERGARGPVETADIVLSSRYELIYRYPVD